MKRKEEGTKSDNEKGTQTKKKHGNECQIPSQSVFVYRLRKKGGWVGAGHTISSKKREKDRKKEKRREKGEKKK